jgi:light-regulated signal transduction histidine kinase (bacteriophytochrome)
MTDRETDPGSHDADSAADSADDTVPPLSSPVTSPLRSHHLSSSASYHPRRSGSASATTPLESRAAVSPSGISTDRVFPVRSVVSVDPTSTPAFRIDRQDDYFVGVQTSSAAERRPRPAPRKHRDSQGSLPETPSTKLSRVDYGASRSNPPRLPPQALSQMVTDAEEPNEVEPEEETSDRGGKSAQRDEKPDENEYTTSRFSHIVTEDGHAIITGRDGEDLQRCEDEPIHIPGAIQSFGLLIAFEDDDGKYIVRIVSENSDKIIGYTPRQLFALESFTDILSEEQADNLIDHVDFVRDEETDVELNGPELFTISVKQEKKRPIKLWCAMHINDRHPDLVICEFELENDTVNPPIHPSEMTPEMPEDTLRSTPTMDEYLESTRNMSRPLRVLRSARKNRGEAAAMEVFNIMSQIQEQLAAAVSLEAFLKVLVGVVKELTGFHRVMVYQFDKAFNGRVVTELVDPRATKDLYKGLNFPASDIPKQARDLYKINRVRLLYNRSQETARLVCRSLEDLQNPLDLTHSYLRAMSPIHLKYLANMAVRASMSISINAFNELWGLISCHSYGNHGMRVSFPIRKMCRLVGDTASRNIERLSYASRLQARKLINTVPTQYNPSGYIIASSEDLLKLFNADFGFLCIQDETKMLGQIDNIQESLAMLEYLKFRRIQSVTTSQDITEDFPDLIYRPGFLILAGMLLVPLSPSGTDFIAFFRKGVIKEVKWAGNPYEKIIREGTDSYLEPRTSFKLWSETVVGKCRDWTEEEVETAAVLCLVYGKFIEVWRQKEAALQNSQLTKLLLANSAHEVRTPLNAIINYLEIALGLSTDAIIIFVLLTYFD